MKWTVIYVWKPQSQMSTCHCSEYPNVHVPLRFELQTLLLLLDPEYHGATIPRYALSLCHGSWILSVSMILFCNCRCCVLILWNTKCEMYVFLIIEPVLQCQNYTPVLKLHTFLDHFSCSESFSRFQVLKPSWGSHIHTHTHTSRSAHTKKKQAADHSEHSMRMQGGEKRERWDHGDGMERTRQGHSRDLLTAESWTWCCTWKRK